MKRAFVAVLCALSIFTIAVGSAAGANMIPKCRTLYTTWKKNRGPNAAFAVASNGSCGASWNYSTLKLAVSGAMKQCAKYGTNCKVIATKKGAPPRRNLRTNAVTEEQALKACQKKYWTWQGMRVFKKGNEWWCRGGN